MTDTTDIAALRDVKRWGIVATGDQYFKFVTKNISDGPYVKQEDYFALLDMLEAERQRADNYVQVSHGPAAELAAVREQGEIWERDARHANAELAALKGDQVPKYWAVVSGYSTEFKYSREDAEHHLNNVNGMFIEELFTAPQKPVVLQDTIDAQRYRWLRGDIPTLNGDPHNFYVWDMRGQQYEECGEHLDGIDLDKAIDEILAAIDAASGIVKDGE